jgi:MFS transporter, PPP family, 3-phenylpropionic acid transporter
VAWLLFFFQYLGVGAYFIYLNVYYTQAGLSGTQIGFIATSASIIAVVSALAWGYISDRTGNPRLLLVIGATGSLVVAQFVPLVDTFWGFFALASLSSLLSSPLFTLVDGVTLAMLGARSENYGRFRLGGSMGFIVASAISGLIYGQTGLTVIFPAYGVVMGMFIITALLLPAIPVKIETRPKAQIGAMIRQPAWIVFALSVFLIWLANYAIINYMGVALIRMGGDEGLVGIASTATALMEIPFMAFSGWFIRRFGLTRLMVTGMLIMVLRYALLGLMPDPNWAIYINLINGPAFAFFATCSVAIARKLAPPTLIVTAQGFLNSIASLAGVVGALLTGMLFDATGPQGIFMGMALSCLAALTLFLVGTFRFRSLRSSDEAI